MRKRKLFYFGLEKVENRYTGQLSHEWFPATFDNNDDIEFIHVLGNDTQSRQIRVGEVFDATGRGKYALDQCSKFLDMIENNEVETGDILYIADYWHPGIESIFYAIDQYGIKLKIYARCWAQSVDEYDFTYKMRHWMRFYELGLDRYLSGIFVGSTIHRDQLKAAGFETPIHVLSLPLNWKKVENTVELVKPEKKKNIVIYASRYDREKNPYFMLRVAENFLQEHPDWEWHCCASSNSIRSNISEDFIDEMFSIAEFEPRFKICSGLSKTDYYNKLAESKIIFNSALQDYVSWTILEATTFLCDVVYPDFRSFSEFVAKDRLYRPFDVGSALDIFNAAIINPNHYHNYPYISDMGRKMEAFIMVNDITEEFNIWHETERIEFLLNASDVQTYKKNFS